LGYHLIYKKSLWSSNYDKGLKAPKIYSKYEVKKFFPEVKEIHGNQGVMMQEAQMIDSRMAINSLLTATIDDYIPDMKGITLANYVEFKDFTTSGDAEGPISGAKLFDSLNDEEFDINAKVIVNCTGIHADEMRI